MELLKNFVYAGVGLAALTSDKVKETVIKNNEIELKKSYLEALKECNKKYLLCDYK